MSKRINIVLPKTTVETNDTMATDQRSRYVDKAGQHFVANRSAEPLRAQLERAAVRDRLRLLPRTPEARTHQESVHRRAVRTEVRAPAGVRAVCAGSGLPAE